MKWKSFDRQFSILRQVIIFVLGVWVVVYAITTTGKDFGYILSGFALLGLIPIERLLNEFTLVRKEPQRGPKPPEPSEPPEEA